MYVCTVHDPSSLKAQPRHPLGSRARVLLTSVFGPYIRDDEYGRVINPMELLHNQVTRVQGAFSIRISHRSWALMLIQANIDAPCTVLDFPTLDRFIEEIRDNHYDIVGIGSILPNFHKVKKMCELIRQHLPRATIVVGGHLANLENLDTLIDADYIVRGEGVRWFRRFLGEDENKIMRHPLLWGGIGQRCMGVNLPSMYRNVAATVIPSVGCPIGCNFCSTSATFGGKGHFINFYQTGDELFDIMCQLEREMKVRVFFIMDENFLLQRPRALRLLELMKKNGKSWILYVFASANALKMYTMEQLVGLGISLVWVGLESKDSQYSKLDNIDTLSLVRELQSHGIVVIGSTILGLENHTPENIDEIIDYAVSHDTDFHQFTLYIALPQTPLHAEMSAKGRLMDSSKIDIADVHGEYCFNFWHAHIKPGDEIEMLLRAFRRDFEVNGPSLLRMMRTMLWGWKRYKNHPDRRIRERIAWEIRNLRSIFAGAIWAGLRWFKNNSSVAPRLSALLNDVYAEFGFKTHLIAPILGRIILFMCRREEKRLAKGWTIEPPTFYERNYDDRAPGAKRVAGQLRWVVPATPSELRAIEKLRAKYLAPSIINHIMKSRLAEKFKQSRGKAGKFPPPTVLDHHPRGMIGK